MKTLTSNVVVYVSETERFLGHNLLDVMRFHSSRIQYNRSTTSLPNRMRKRKLQASGGSESLRFNSRLPRRFTRCGRLFFVFGACKIGHTVMFLISNVLFFFSFFIWRFYVVLLLNNEGNWSYNIYNILIHKKTKRQSFRSHNSHFFKEMPFFLFFFKCCHCINLLLQIKNRETRTQIFTYHSTFLNFRLPDLIV